MKKSVIVLIVAALVLVTTLFWFFSGYGEVKPIEFVSLGVIFLVVLFALFVGYKRLSSIKKGEPAEDEMSRKVMQKASSISFYISLYLWLAIGYFSDRFNYETHTVIGTGILGMAVTFAICWVVIYFRGIRNE